MNILHILSKCCFWFHSTTLYTTSVYIYDIYVLMVFYNIKHLCLQSMISNLRWTVTNLSKTKDGDILQRPLSFFETKNYIQQYFTCPSYTFHVHTYTKAYIVRTIRHFSINIYIFMLPSLSFSFGSIFVDFIYIVLNIY